MPVISKIPVGKFAGGYFLAQKHLAEQCEEVLGGLGERAVFQPGDDGVGRDLGRDEALVEEVAVREERLGGNGEDREAHAHFREQEVLHDAVGDA